jgi:ribonuclease HI
VAQEVSRCITIGTDSQTLCIDCSEQYSANSKSLFWNRNQHEKSLERRLKKSHGDFDGKLVMILVEKLNARFVNCNMTPGKIRGS